MSNKDYELEEMENAAVNKSKNLKRGLLAGAGVIGVGASTAYGATHFPSSGEKVENSELTEEDILAGANAGVEDATSEDSQSGSSTTHTAVEESHVYHHHIIETPETAEPAVEEPVDLNVVETGVIYDEDGELITAYDAGFVDDKVFIAYDTDMNGRADLVAIDANNNGVFEDHEFHTADNESYVLGQGEHISAYVQTSEGDLINIMSSDDANAQNLAEQPHEPIHNDFDDEHTGERYHGDLAYNNSDYNNRGGEQYRAEMSAPEHADVETYPSEELNVSSGYEYEDTYAEHSVGGDEMYGDENVYTEELTAYNAEEESYTEPADYGYTDPSDDMASFDASAESFDDSTFA